MHEPTDATSRCPLCEGPNACGASGPEAAACWCFSVSFAAGVLAAVPEAARGRRCVCRGCAMAPPQSAATPPVAPSREASAPRGVLDAGAQDCGSAGDASAPAAPRLSRA